MLKDDDLRKKYDMHGEEGLKEDGPSGRGYRSWNFYKEEFGNMNYIYVAILFSGMQIRLCTCMCINVHTVTF